jgi:hypothetical protein
MRHVCPSIYARGGTHTTTLHSVLWSLRLSSLDLEPWFASSPALQAWDMKFCSQISSHLASRSHLYIRSKTESHRTTYPKTKASFCCTSCACTATLQKSYRLETTHHVPILYHTYCEIIFQRAQATFVSWHILSNLLQRHAA